MPNKPRINFETSEDLKYGTDVKVAEEGTTIKEVGCHLFSGWLAGKYRIPGEKRNAKR